MSPELPDTPWDKRVVRAMTAAETARQGAVILRVLADDDQTGGTDDEPGRELPPPLLR